MTSILDIIEILVIEDNKADYRIVEKMLEGERGFELNWATRLSGGYEILTRPDKDIAVILLDLNLPESRGLETLSKVREKYDHLPIIVMTGLDDEEQGITAAQRGAQEYLTKGEFDKALLTRAIRWAIERNRLQQKLMEMLVIDIKGIESRQLLPACASCGYVRDQVITQWVTMASYLEEHANLFQSHGLCPPCMQKHYGQILDQEKKLRQEKKEGSAPKVVEKKETE